MVQFKNDEHEERYYAALAKMKSTDCYHRAVAYLFTLDRDCARYIDDVFDFRGDGINTDGLHSGWQTGTSVQTTRLAFNLWNGFIEKGEEKLTGFLFKADMQPSKKWTNFTMFLVNAEELAEKSARLEQLNRELEVGQADEVIMNESEDDVQNATVKTEEIAKPSPKPKR